MIWEESVTTSHFKDKLVFEVMNAVLKALEENTTILMKLDVNSNKSK